ncbi:MAG: homoserine kinase [Elusimicrobiota bacterium]|jgi:homoserine kinase|nr:homoserine kinase [Elusimicrobiota bacterium]
MRITFRLPASTSNFGSGFDVLGAALTLYNEFSIEQVSMPAQSGIFISGQGCKGLPKDEANIVWKILQETLRRLGKPAIKLSEYKLTISCNVPLASGLGSSATAAAAGIALADAVSNAKLTKQNMAEIATEIEGHPDNAVPCIMGGLCLCFLQNGKLDFCKIDTQKLKIIIAHPAFEISTHKARQALLKEYPLADIVFNISHASLFVFALQTQRYDLLEAALDDKIHQPYRIKNIDYADEVFNAAKKAGAFGTFISGSGPSLAAISNSECAQGIAQAMKNAWVKRGIETKSFILDFDEQGLVRL